MAGGCSSCLLLLFLLKYQSLVSCLCTRGTMAGFVRQRPRGWRIASDESKDREQWEKPAGDEQRAEARKNEKQSDGRERGRKKGEVGKAEFLALGAHQRCSRFKVP